MTAKPRRSKAATKTKTKAKTKAKPKVPARKSPAPALSISVVEIDPASFPDDVREHAIALAPLVRQLREQASKRPKQMLVGPPTTRDRVEALAKHYSASLLPDYTALMMLADGIRVEDSYRLFTIDELMGPKLTKRSEKLRGGYGDCLPVGLFSLSGGWLFVMARWGEPYCEKIGGMKIQGKSVTPWLARMVKDAKKLPRF